MPQSELLQIYKDLDTAVQNSISKTEMKVSCEKGCDYCCYLLTSITIPEGILLAQKIFGMSDWKDQAQRLKDHALKCCYDGVDNRSYFDKDIPCFFLGSDHLCTVYEERPACCRFHFTISDKELCSNKAPEDVETKILNLRPAEQVVWEYAVSFQRETGFGGPIPQIAPISLMVLFCMLMLADDGDDAKFMSEVVKAPGLKDPTAWSLEAMMRVSEEVRNGTRPAESE